MKNPVFGSNRLQSFIDFFTTFGNLRFGLEGLRLFTEQNTSKKYIDGKLVNQIFNGIITLSNDLTHYTDWTAINSAEVLLASDPIIGGSAEIRMIGDGTHIPTFSVFTKSSGSGDFDPTLNAINKIIFYYDGTEAFYSITVL